MIKYFRHTFSLCTLLFIIALLTLSLSCQRQQSSEGDNKNKEQTLSQEIKSLPYLSWVPIKKEDKLKSGVVEYDSDLAYSGVSIYNSKPKSIANLIDMEGNVIHSWSSHLGETEGWHHIEMDGEGNLFVIVEDRLLMKLNWNSTVQWVSEYYYHHDIAIADNGDVYSFTSDELLIPFSGRTIPITDDFITILSPAGEVKKRMSIYKLFKEKIPQERLNQIVEILSRRNVETKIKEIVIDVFHSNTIEILDKDLGNIARKGDLLVSMRELNLIAIVNVEREEVLWQWGEHDLDKQHHPTLLKNGNILIYDNGTDRGYSRIIELNPLTKKIEWEYRGNRKDPFYSSWGGASQRLPNGNTLITDTENGRVFEITEEGNIVWSFYTPDIDLQNNKRATIYRMMRVEPSPRVRELIEMAKH